MSELLKKSPEVNDTHHEQIVALLRSLDLMDEEDKAVSCIFDQKDFGGRLLLAGYERVTVEIDETAIGVRLVHLPFGDKQDTDTYSYRLDNQSLTLQQTTRDYDDQFEEWARQYDETNEELEELQDSATSAYHAVMTTIRSHGKSDPQVVAVFDHYDRENERIMATREETGQSDELEYQHVENEVKMIDLFEAVAGSVPERVMMLQKYRETLLAIQQMQSKLDILSEQLDSIQIFTVIQPTDSAEFLHALQTVAGLMREMN